MTQQIACNDNITTQTAALPELCEVEALANNLKRMLVRCEQALVNGGTRDHVEKLERWIESYRRGLTAAQKISDNGTEMLQKTRDQLKLSLDELLRLENEGGNAPTQEQLADSEELTSAIERIDHLMPVLKQSFQAVKINEPELA